MSGEAASVLETLRKVLALEARPPRAYQDRSTNHGLGSFFSVRMAEVSPGSKLHVCLQQLQKLFSRYDELDLGARRTAVQRARRLLAEATEVSDSQSSKASLLQDSSIERNDNVVLLPEQTPRDLDRFNDEATGPGRKTGASVSSVAAEATNANTTRGRAMLDPRRRLGVIPRSAGRGCDEDNSGLQLSDSVQGLPGVGTKTGKALARLGIITVLDLILHFPRRHLDRSQFKRIDELTVGIEATVKGVVGHVQNVRTRFQRRTITEAIIRDGSVSLRVIWFNQPYMARVISRSQVLVLSGKPEFSARGGLQMVAPEIEFDADDLIHTGRLVPVYPKTEGVTDRSLRRWIKLVLEKNQNQLMDYLPESVRREGRLIDYRDAVPAYHFPSDLAAREAAVRRLAFDELFLLQLGLLRRKREWQGAVRGISIPIADDFVARFTAHLPFELTGSQETALAQILDSLGQPIPMSRLLQGDVGSGKTVVAAAALVAATEAQFQGALMVPTEVLAQQHHQTLKKLLAPFNLRVELLVGSMKKSIKSKIWNATGMGDVNVLVGTHALIQDAGRFSNLGLVVVDEQHRFGVRQRTALRDKGHNPDMLVMTATPIPRTLALTVYGDLDLSVIDELPPGRQTIMTKWIPPSGRTGAYEFLQKQVGLGRQAFVICPLIDESMKIEARAARLEFERLTRQFPELRLGLLHGRLKPKEKERVMGDFRDGQIDMLVSTAVVEVGIDVPNATVMVIEGAERFGLAQLHQFRGRVGRGAHASYCLLFSETTDPGKNPRLRAIEEIQDGFGLAEEDLRLRGPGEFFGIRQTGVPDLQVANLSDISVLTLARELASGLVQQDPDLLDPEHAPLRNKLEKFWERGAGAA